MTRRPSLLCALGALLVAAAVTTVGPPSALAAGGPCWKQVLDDWYDGKIDARYPIPCYGKAIEHLPFDTRLYSTAETDIRSAMYDTMRARGLAVREPSNGEDRRLVGKTDRRLQDTSGVLADTATRTAATADATKPPLTLVLGAAFAMLLIAFGTLRLLIARRHTLRLLLKGGGPWRRG